MKDDDRRLVQIYYARGVSLERSNRWNEAERDFRQALKLNPERADVLNYLGYTFVDKGINLEEAVSMLEKARALRPLDGMIADSVGWAYYKLGRYQEAARTLEEAVQLAPGASDINDHLGDAYWRIGRKIDARFQWQHALALEPDAEAEGSHRAQAPVRPGFGVRLRFVSEPRARPLGVAQSASSGGRVSRPAKLNLFLHVGDKRPDGYHALQSLVAFAEAGDVLEIAPASELSLSVSGPFAAQIPRGTANLVAQSRTRALRAGSGRAARCVDRAREKPARRRGAWRRLGRCGRHVARAQPAVGARIARKTNWSSSRARWAPMCQPACCRAPAGWKDAASTCPAPVLSRRSISMLVNPGVLLPTAGVFATLNARTGTSAMEPPSDIETLWDLVAYLEDSGNDLEAPATRLQPVIDEVLEALHHEPGCVFAQMSGSGATCFGLFNGREYALGAAGRIAQDHPQWWVKATRIAAPDIGAPRQTLIRPFDHEIGDLGERRLDVAVGRDRQRIACFARIASRAFDRRRERAAALEEFDRAREIAFLLHADLDRLAPEAAFVVARIHERQDDRKRHLAFAEIVADRFAHHRLASRIIERIVDELERDAEIVAVGAHRLRVRFAGARDHGAGFGGGREQRCGLGRRSP